MSSSSSSWYSYRGPNHVWQERVQKDRDLHGRNKYDARHEASPRDNAGRGLLNLVCGTNAAPKQDPGEQLLKLVRGDAASSVRGDAASSKDDWGAAETIADEPGSDAFLDSLKVKGGTEISLTIKARSLDGRLFRAGLSSSLRQAILTRCRSLKTVTPFVYINVDVSHCGLGPPSMKALVVFLRTLQQPSPGPPIFVKELRAFKNQLGDGGARHVAELIASQPKPLHELHLSHNRIGNKGAAEIIMSLGHLHPHRTYPFRLPGKSKQFGACWLRMEWNDIDWPDQLVWSLMDSKHVRIEATSWTSRIWGPSRSPDWAKTADLTPHCVLHIFYIQEATPQGLIKGHSCSAKDRILVDSQTEAAYKAVEKLVAGFEGNLKTHLTDDEADHYKEDRDGRQGSSARRRRKGEDAEGNSYLGADGVDAFESKMSSADGEGSSGKASGSHNHHNDRYTAGGSSSSSGSSGRWGQRRWQVKESLPGIEEDAASAFPLRNAAPSQVEGPGPPDAAKQAAAPKAEAEAEATGSTTAERGSTNGSVPGSASSAASGVSSNSNVSAPVSNGTSRAGMAAGSQGGGEGDAAGGTAPNNHHTEEGAPARPVSGTHLSEHTVQLMARARSLSMQAQDEKASEDTIGQASADKENVREKDKEKENGTDAPIALAGKILQANQSPQRRSIGGSELLSTSPANGQTVMAPPNPPLPVFGGNDKGAVSRSTAPPERGSGDVDFSGSTAAFPSAKRDPGREATGPASEGAAPRPSNSTTATVSGMVAPPGKPIASSPASVTSDSRQWLLSRFKAEMFTDEDKREVEECLKVLGDAIRKLIGPGWNVSAFGSVVTGFGTHNCDLDVVAHEAIDSRGESEEQKDPASMLGKLGSLLRTSDSGIDVKETILHARIPILKLQYKQREVDLSMNNTLPLLNTRLLKAYAALDPRVVQLGVLVKMWARTNSLSGAPAGHLSSYALTLMVLFFLQVEHRLPSLQRDTSDTVWETDEGAEAKVAKVKSSDWSMTACLDQLFSGFFSFYSDTFRWGTEVVSVRLGQRAVASSVEQFSELKGRLKHQLHIEDPFERSRNLRDVLWAKNELSLKETIRQCHHHFCKEEAAESYGATSRGKKLVNPRPRQTTGGTVSGHQGKGSQRRAGQQNWNWGAGAGANAGTAPAGATASGVLETAWYATWGPGSQPGDTDPPPAYGWPGQQKGGWSRGPPRDNADTDGAGKLDSKEPANTEQEPSELLGLLSRQTLDNLMGAAEGLVPSPASSPANAVAGRRFPSGHRPLLADGARQPGDCENAADADSVQEVRRRGTGKLPKYFAPGGMAAELEPRFGSGISVAALEKHYPLEPARVSEAALAGLPQQRDILYKALRPDLSSDTRSEIVFQ